MTKNEEFLVRAVFAMIGGFWVGRFTAPEQCSPGSMLGKGQPSPPIELPPVSTPSPEPRGDGEPGEFAERWDALAWNVDVYPVSADRTRISPPSGPGDASASSDCSIVAVTGDGWWDRAGFIAQEMVDLGERDAGRIAARIIRDLLPSCRNADTEATRQLSDEIGARLDQVIPGVVFPPPRPPINAIARRNPYPRSYANKPPARKRRRRRRGRRHSRVRR